MSTKRSSGYLLSSTLILFIGSFIIHGNIVGKTTAIAPVYVEIAEPITLKEIEESTPAFEKLVQAIRANPQRIPILPPSKIDAETLWLARGIYSETKRPEEMELVAWVIRNRVETGYRGRDTYRGVILDPYQFSAFNHSSRSRRFYASLEPTRPLHSWQAALAIAHGVRWAESEYRPFSLTTRHFYSEQSMIGRRHPVWALGKSAVTPQRDFHLDERRFRFYDSVS